MYPNSKAICNILLTSAQDHFAMIINLLLSASVFLSYHSAILFIIDMLALCN